MKRIAIISGPALGHVASLFKAALAINLISDAEITFIHPNSKDYVPTLTKNKFKSVAIPFENDTVITRALTFSKGAEKHFSKNSYDLILQNINPLPWTSLLKFPDIPRIVMTQIFLTATADLKTVQKTFFPKLQQQLNYHRAEKGLEPLSNAYDLYEADRVLLADPIPIIEEFPSLPDHHRACGACSWSKTGQLPKEIQSTNNLLLLSMGSTGKNEFRYELIDLLKNKINAQACVYLGNKNKQNKSFFDYSYQWLPLKNITSRCIATISQGGAGSTYLSLKQSCPTFIYPNHGNQQLLGDIIERMGLGLCLNNDTDLNKIRDLDFAEMQARTNAFAKKMKKEEGDHEIARQVLKLL